MALSCLTVGKLFHCSWPIPVILSDPGRLQAVEESGLLNTSVDEAFEQLNRLASVILRGSVSIFSVFGKDTQSFKSFVGLPEGITPGAEFPIDISVCKYALEGKPVQFFDTKNETLFKENAAVKQLNMAGYLGIPVVTKDGHAIGTVCVFDSVPRTWTGQDIDNLRIITNSFLTEIELRIALKRSEEEVAKREEFMAIAAHEMKNPLTSMKLYADLSELKVKKGTFVQKDFDNFLGVFRRQFGRVNLLIDDMFDASRIKSGNFSVRLEKFDLNVLLATLSENFQSKFQDSGAELILSCEPGLIGNWDAFRLEQVLTNLLTNALKYAPGSQVNLTGRRSETSVIIEVQDFGPGISEAAQNKIFQALERINTKNEVSGLGLGLYISRKIIAEHKGDVKIHSELGAGSTFTITLPLEPTAVILPK